MLVRDVMNTKIESCAPADNLATAAGVMWRNDCGVVPIVGDDRKVVGVITDRDICMAVATRSQRACDIRVGEACSGQVHACAPEDDVRRVLKTMEEHRIRRLPVVDRGAGLVGRLSLHDLVRRVTPTRGRGGSGISYEEVVAVFKALTEPAAEPVGAGTR